MSKVKLNATTVDLVSSIKLADIQLLEKVNPNAITTRDENGTCLFKVMTGPVPCATDKAVMFRDADLAGYATITLQFTPQTANPNPEDLFEGVYDKIGAAKAKLDAIEPTIAAAVEAEHAAKAAFINALKTENGITAPAQE